MAYHITSYNLIGWKLNRDIYSDRGILLLTSGTTLEAHNITMLLNQGIYRIDASTQIAENISSQINDVWLRQDLETSEIYLHNLTTIKELFQKIHEQKLPPVDVILHTFTPLLDAILNQSYLLYPLHKIKGYDEYTYRHSINVGLVAAVIGKLLRLSKREIYLLGEMGLLHDIGKMKLRQDILFKTNALSALEYEEMKKHTIYGYELLQSIEGVDMMIKKGALSHHEKLDGSGYPHKLRGDEVPFLIQILTVADIYDAICSDRVYQDKSTPFSAAKELMNEMYEGKLNPKIVIPFVRHLIEGYVGNYALLENGDRGEVIMIHPEEPDRPLIRLGSQFIDLRHERDLQIVDLIPR